MRLGVVTQWTLKVAKPRCKTKGDGGDDFEDDDIDEKEMEWRRWYLGCNNNEEVGDDDDDNTDYEDEWSSSLQMMTIRTVSLWCKSC